MDVEICDDFMVGKFAPALLTTAHEHSRGNFHFSISRFAGTFIFQFRDFNFDTGTVAGIFIFQFRELNWTVAGILIFQFRDFNFDTGTVAGIFTSFFQSIPRTRARTRILTTAHEHSRGNFHSSTSRFAGTFIFQFRDFNFDTGTVAGIFIF